jgi:branched-chain amino acid transport system substrate-binding protein
MEDDAMEDDAMEDDAMEDDAMEDDAMEDDAMEDAPAGLADDSVDGIGAERVESMINNPVGPADDSLEPVLITMANLEGDAIGSFPEIREGLEIAIADINENWGGVGGRPIELDVCVHGFDPNAAINCGNEIAEAQPNLNINGIEFFTPALWPTFLGANIPTIQTVPIFVSDFTVVGNGISPFGGCPVAFPSAATYTMEFLGLQKVAVVYANTPPGLECYADTEERFWDYLVENEVDGEYLGLPDNSGDPSDDDAVVQQIADFFGDTPADQTAVFFGTQASDCNAIMSAVSAAGLDTQIIASGSCVDDSVLSNPAAVGAQFGNQARISTRPDLYPGWGEFELNWRNQLLEDSDLRSTPVSAFLRVGHTAGVFAWNTFNDMLEAGEDIDDPQAVIDWLAAIEDVHLIANNPISCSDNTEEFPAVCKKDNTFVVWDGEAWDPESSPLGGEYFSVDDIQARVAAGNPRPDAG